ncbi:MAG TPA: lycopene beta-cyclase CrtY [Polyangiaceae bacterium]|nr:lycopene beta-cyclase CrtY [Polyangiaceae bacterium]
MMTGSGPDARFDALLVGGGLANGLIALALLNARPEARVAIVERDGSLAGNHTWSFHDGDVPEAARPFVEPLVTARWPAYTVRFPGHERRVGVGYASITSARLREVVEARFAESAGSRIFTGASVDGVREDSVTLADGTVLRGEVVVDARGPSLGADDSVLGYQKFVGLELELEGASPVTEPLLMDATVPQTDGFRFFYTLPFDARTVLVEDTYFADTPDLDVPRLERGVLEYAALLGLRVSGIRRRERGVLPMPGKRRRPSHAAPLVAGYAGGWFHPATAYSFPVAVRLALHVADTAPTELFGEAYASLEREHGVQFRFGAFLNRLLFGAFRPETRWNALDRFYRLPEGTIRRFYAMETTRGDRFRIVCGRPPRGLSLRLSA